MNKRLLFGILSLVSINVLCDECSFKSNATKLSDCEHLQTDNGGICFLPNHLDIILSKLNVSIFQNIENKENFGMGIKDGN